MSGLIVTKSARRAILSVGGLLVIALTAIASFTGGATVTGAESELPVAPFELFEGGEATFADFEGKPLVINFWASWCPACVAELPDLQAVNEQLGDRVTFLGLANSDRRDGAVALADEVGLTYTLADDPTGELFTALGLISMPSTIFVDANGRIEQVFGGVLNEALLLDRIEELLGES